MQKHPLSKLAASATILMTAVVSVVVVAPVVGVIVQDRAGLSFAAIVVDLMVTVIVVAVGLGFLERADQLMIAGLDYGITARMALGTRRSRGRRRPPTVAVEAAAPQD